MPLGAWNPVPFRVGGGPTPTQRAYETLRNAVGEGGSAPNDRGIEGLWRRSEAKGLAASASHCRRALLQASPLLATDLLPYYERILGIVPGPNATEAARREVVVEAWTKRAASDMPTLAERLAAVDARFSLIESPHEQAATVQDGRTFAPLTPEAEGPPFALERGHVQCPAYSSDLVVRVLFAVGHTGPLTSAELAIVDRARAVLRDALPSTTDFSIAVDSGADVTPGQWHVGVTPIGFGGVS
jgi:hypothetical protein